jgi:hypothetical protein
VLEIETDLPPPLSSEMRKLTLAILFLVLVSFTSVNSSFATCWVLDGTFYAKNKNDMIKFAKAQLEGDPCYQESFS